VTGAASESRRVPAERPQLDLRALARSGPVHFIGISGAGMSAIAELLLRSGGRVTGSDLQPGETAAALRALGAEIREGHDAGYVAGAVAVVATAAVPSDHVELAAARALGVPVIKRAQALASLVNRGTVVAVAGTHGKTTTTAMATAILTAAELEPTAFVGGRVGDWGGGLRVGSERLFVVEADEYDRSFLTLEPDVAVVTSIEADHLDVYGSVEEVRAAFATFVDALPAEGLLAACADDSGAAQLALAHTASPTLTYGTSPTARLRALDVRPEARGSRFNVMLDGEPLGALSVAAPGLHNVRNALGAYGAARHVGADFDAAARGLAAFHGVARRFQEIGTVRGITFIDDYAHHPTELAVTLAAARTVFPGRRIVALFQPHLFTRTRDFAAEFGAVLARADAVYVTNVYAARERPIAGVSGASIVDAARAAGARELHYVERLADVPAMLVEGLRAGDVCVAMGAGDIDRIARHTFATLAGDGEP
jgi:UDP-N-acetylmuramate--alanine ligase